MAIDSWSDIYGTPGPALAPGGSFPRREDLLMEHLLEADSSGNVTSDWYPTDGFLDVRVAGKFLGPASPSFTVEEGQRDGAGAPRVIRSHSLTVSSGKFFEELGLTARAIRVVATGAGNAGYVAVTIRKVN